MFASFYQHQPVTFAIASTVIFVIVFASIVIRIFLPGARRRADADARLPLDEEIKS